MRSILMNFAPSDVILNLENIMHNKHGDIPGLCICVNQGDYGLYLDLFTKTDLPS